jgi:hypothetical protein
VQTETTDLLSNETTNERTTADEYWRAGRAVARVLQRHQGARPSAADAGAADAAARLGRELAAAAEFRAFSRELAKGGSRNENENDATSVWTVVESCDGEVTTWTRSFRSYEAAVAAVRENAAQLADEWLGDPKLEYLGTEYGDTQVFALVETVWRVVETTLEG